jgi:site-specific recombinase XerD
MTPQKFYQKGHLLRQLSEGDKMNTTGQADPKRLIAGYQLCASTEGISPSAIAIVITSVNLFQKFQSTQPDGKRLTDVTRYEIRAFISHLQQTRCFATHPFNRTQEKGLSGHTINCYLRSLRIFYSWLVSEEILEVNPFNSVKIPRPPVKVIPTFSGSQIEQLLKAINKNTATGYRDFAIILTLLDTGIRISEICSLKMEKLRLEEGVAIVLGKGNKERMVPIGKQLQRVLWHYIERCRPEPTTIKCSYVFLTQAGKPLTRGRAQKMMTRYGQKAKLAGIRCSPHTLRHTAAISFLRNGGDVFSLQRMLGHANLEMTRRYCELAAIDIKRAHDMASPVDNLHFATAEVFIRSHVLKSSRPSRRMTPAALADMSTNLPKGLGSIENRNHPKISEQRRQETS